MRALKADGFDKAIIGIARRCGQADLVAYDVGKCIEVLTEDMTEEEAIEYFEFNVVGAWMGEGTPVFIYPDEAEEVFNYLAESEDDTK